MTPKEWAEKVAELLTAMAADHVSFDLYDGEVSVEGGDYLVIQDWRVPRTGGWVVVE